MPRLLPPLEFRSRRASRLLAVLLVLAAASPRAAPPTVPIPDAVYADLDALYVDLHRNPELSSREEKTAAKLAARMRALGYEVTEHVGGTGVVGVLRNGKGPTVMLRTQPAIFALKTFPRVCTTW